MKKVKLIVFLLLFTGSVSELSGQELKIVTGTLINQDSLPISNVSIKISLDEDSSKVVFAQTDRQGKFYCKLSVGYYHISVSHLSYGQYDQRIYIDRSLELSIILKSSSEKLPEVIVKADEKMIVQKADRIIFNAENASHLQGTTSWDVLKRVPTVRVDFRSRITVNGQGAMVMIDDRILRLSNEELESMLQGLQADNILKIEVIPIPPAKYDAQGGALINIITRKKLSEGVKGAFRSGFSQAEFSKWNIGSDLNIKSKKLQLTTNTTIRGGKAFADINDYVHYLNSSNQIISRWNVSNTRTRKTLLPSIRIDGSVEIDSLNMLTFSVFSSHNKILEGLRVSNTVVSDALFAIDSSMKSINASSGFETTTNANIGYSKKLNSRGGVISGEIDFLKFDNQPNQTLSNTVFDRSGMNINEFQFKQNSTQRINLLSGKFDVINPLKNGSTLEYGIKFVTIKTTNKINSYTFIFGQFEPDILRSNEFMYTERIAAGYMSFSRSFKKLSIKGGIRIEQTTNNGVSTTLATTNKNSYFNLFPSLFTSYRTGENLNLNLSFARRIERPGFWRLNPFEYFVTPYYSMKGNPFLIPSYPLQLQLSLLHKQKTSLSLFYFNSPNFFTNITNQSNDDKTLQDLQVNLGNSISYGFNFMTPIDLVKGIWVVDALVQGQFQDESSVYLNSYFRNKNFNLYSSFSNRFTLSKKKDVRGEISFWHTSPTVQGIFSIRGQSDLSASIRFPIFQKNGTLNISVGDILRTQRYIIDVNYLNQRNGFFERRDTRFAAVSLMYRFGNKRTFKPKNRKESGIEDETRRLKS